MNENQPLVSIVTPCYNHESYIGSCIDSAINQTFPYWEMIVINDGSNDNTAKIVESFVQKDTRIRLFNQKNKGIFRLAETYNEALKHSNGKYIAILEGDDLWKPEKLERQIKIMESDPDLILTWGLAEVLNETTRNITTLNNFSIQQDVFNNDPPGTIFKELFFENHIPAATLLIRKDILLEIGGFKQNFHLPLVDLPTIFELIPKGRFFFDQHILATWRISGIQVTKVYPVEILKGRWDLVRHHINQMDKETLEKLGISQKAIDTYFSDKMLIAYARSGRYRLLRRDFKGGRKDYLKAIFFVGFRQPVWRCRAIIGFVFSLFGWNVEGLSKFLGKVSY